MSKALRRPANVSATISVPPSGVITEPFGKTRSSAKTLALPSGSTRTSTAAFGASPPIRSQPKLPT